MSDIHPSHIHRELYITALLHHVCLANIHICQVLQCFDVVVVYYIAIHVYLFLIVINANMIQLYMSLHYLLQNSIVYVMYISVYYVTFHHNQ